MTNCLTIWDLISDRAQHSPERVFTVDESGRELTFQQYKIAAEKTASWLHQQGVCAESRVAWQLPTSQESFVLLGALSRLAAVQIPLLPFLRERELSFICGQVQPKMLIVPTSWKDFDYQVMALSIAKKFPDMRVVGLSAGEIPQSEAALPDEVTQTDDTLLPARWIFCSSGTTSDPKAILHGDDAILSTAFGMMSVVELSGRDVVPMVFPFTHIGGVVWVTSILLSGCKCLLVDSFSNDIFSFLRENGVTVIGAGTPFFLAYLKAQQQSDSPLFPQVRCFPGGGSPTPIELHREMKQAFNGSKILNGYGLTECPITTMCSVGDPQEQLATEGRVLPGMQIKIVTEGGKSASCNEIGEIRVRGPHMCRGYVDEELNKTAFDDDGFLLTGDLGSLDEGGWLSITGRLKDMIIRKGENISAKKIEDLLYENPLIADVAIIGLPDSERGELVCAVVECKEGNESLTFSAMSDYCLNAGCIRQEVPERLEIVEKLPRNPSGKVLKAALKKQYS